MPFSLKTIKSVDLLCASPASTVIAPSCTEPPETPRLSRTSKALQRLNTLFSHRESDGGYGDIPRSSADEGGTIELSSTPRASFFSRERSRKGSAEKSLFELPFTPRAAFFGKDRIRQSSAEKSMFEWPFTPRAAFFGREKSRKSSAEKSMFELPFTPRAAFFGRENSRKSSAEHNGRSRNSMMAMMMVRRKSSADVYDLYTHPPSSSSSKHLLSDMQDPNPPMGPRVPTCRKPPARPGDKTTIRRDDRLNTTTSLTDSQHRGSSIALVPGQLAAPKLASSSAAGPSINSRGTTGSPPAALMSSAPDQSRNQVVVLRVSLHCKGCEAKLRKHISKMKGVTSFSIDLPSKKVTINGNVTPMEVLTSISKVKYAQFWPSVPPVAPSTVSASAASMGFIN